LFHPRGVVVVATVVGSAVVVPSTMVISVVVVGCVVASSVVVSMIVVSSRVVVITTLAVYSVTFNENSSGEITKNVSRTFARLYRYLQYALV